MGPGTRKFKIAPSTSGYAPDYPTTVCYTPFPLSPIIVFDFDSTLVHIHANEPGVLAAINRVMADNKANILGQYLKTNERIGYVITDVSKKYQPKIVEELKKVPHTIRFRVLY